MTLAGREVGEEAGETPAPPAGEAPTPPAGETPAPPAGETPAPPKKTRSRLWFFVVVALVAAAVLLGLMALDPSRRYASHAMSDWDGAWWEWAASDAKRNTKRIEMPKRSSAGQKAAIPGVPARGEVLVFGNSAAREAFDAAAFKKATGIRAHNFGLTTATVSDFVLAGFEPEAGSTVILILNGPAMDGRVRRDTGLPWYRESTGFTAWVEEFNDMRRATSEIASSRLVEAVRRVAGRVPNDVAWGTARRVYRYETRLSAEALADQKREMLAWYGSKDETDPPTSIERDQLSSIQNRAIEGQWRLIVAWLPTGDADVEAHFREHRVAALGARTEWLELGSGLVAADYHDLGHLLASGRAKVTAELAAHVAEGMQP